MGKYFTIEELTKSSTAKTKRIDNMPNKGQKENLELLILNILDPLREAYGKPISVSSGFRSWDLNRAVGGAKASQHAEGQASDIYGATRKENRIIFDLAQKLNLPFDQLISEKGTETEPSWIHISYSPRNRRQVLRIK